VPNINLHLKAIFDEGELAEEATVKPYLFHYVFKMALIQGQFVSRRIASLFDAN